MEGKNSCQNLICKISVHVFTIKAHLDGARIRTRVLLPIVEGSAELKVTSV